MGIVSTLQRAFAFTRLGGGSVTGGSELLRDNWPDSPLLRNSRFRRKSNFWVATSVKPPVLELHVHEDGSGTFTGAMVVSVPKHAAALLVLLAGDRGLMPPIIEPPRWLALYGEVEKNKALLATFGPWRFCYYRDGQDRGVFMSRRGEPSLNKSALPDPLDTSFCLANWKRK
jgi:hypothetical protein